MKSLKKKLFLKNVSTKGLLKMNSYSPLSFITGVKANKTIEFKKYPKL